jgi:hypothetical protein
MQNYHHDRDDHAEHTADDACTLTHKAVHGARPSVRFSFWCKVSEVSRW